MAYNHMKGFVPFALLTALIFAVACNEGLYRYRTLKLGTVINVTVIGPKDQADKAVDRLFGEIERLENLLSPYRKGSDIYRINSVGTKAVKISRETFMLMEKSLEISRATDGAFDITFASLQHLWNFRKQPFVPPSISEVKKKLHLVDYKNVLLDRNALTVKLKRRGVKVGLGGIAKGYAIEKGIDVLKEAGIKSAIVEEGGDLQILGSKKGVPWITGLRDPVGGGLLCAIECRDGDAVVTSGGYERGAVYRGKRYHHIIDPRTGFPADTAGSVTVVDKDPLYADALATAIFVMGREKAIRYCKQNKKTGCIIVGPEGTVFVTSNLKGRLKLLKEITVRWI